MARLAWCMKIHIRKQIRFQKSWCIYRGGPIAVHVYASEPQWSRLYRTLWHNFFKYFLCFIQRLMLSISDLLYPQSILCNWRHIIKQKLNITSWRVSIWSSMMKFRGFVWSKTGKLSNWTRNGGTIRHSFTGGCFTSVTGIMLWASNCWRLDYILSQ